MGGICTGAVFGVVASVLSSESTNAVDYVIIAVVAVVAGSGLYELITARRPKTIVQRNVETPLEWTSKSGAEWALKNGFALGAGVGTRIGFSVWYIMPITALALGTFFGSVAIFAVYGFCRTAFVTVLYALSLRTSASEIADLLLRHLRSARRIAGASAVLLSIFLAALTL